MASETTASNTSAATKPDCVCPQRWPKHAVWLGLVITLAGFLSYFAYFFQFPGLRDFPVLNLPVVLLGLALAGTGCWRVLRGGRGVLGKAAAAVSFLLTLGVAGLFNFYVFYFSYQLPEASGAPTIQAAAPDFTLLDQNSQSVRLSDFRGKNVVLVFYRGFW